MEVFESVYQNPILREYFNTAQFKVTPWVNDPNGFSHPFVFDFEKNFLIKPMLVTSTTGCTNGGG